MNSHASRIASGAALISITSALIGCAGLPADPYAKPTTTTTTAPAPASTSPAPARPGPDPSPRATVRAFTKSFINWKFANVPAIKTALIPRTTGVLAVQLRRDADAALVQASRRTSNQSNSGTVEAIAAKPRGGFLIVTRETAHLGDTAEQSGYFVYRASTIRVGNTFRLIRFEAVN
jgi:hypothetical protein